MSSIYHNPPKDPKKPRRYSTIDQFIDGKAKVKPRPGRGPFYNKNAIHTLTEKAKEILNGGK